MSSKVELLSPAGNFECLKMAINAGCDAVYISGKNYGARAYANNFSNEEIVCAVRYAHLRGVKVYVTVNTIIYESELSNTLDYLKFLYENNVDAVIVQDLGIIKLITENIPGLEIHASTQCHNHNINGINILKEYGVKRVVLDREMSLSEIKPLTKKIDTEVFVHGALCVSYSGCCLFSSMENDRSGNRGKCIQSCRHYYKINNEEGYLLSTKELCTIKNLSKMIESGITSFKIEGRMKSPLYVGIVTSIYRKYIDKYYNHEDMTVANEDINILLKLFNRKFTNGFINDEKNIINSETANHQGVVIGKVICLNNKKITIKLNEPLYQNDGIRFKESNTGMIINKLYNSKGLLVNNINDIAVIDNKIGLTSKDIVCKTIDSNLEKNYLFTDKKIPIDITVTCLLDKKIEIIVTDGINYIKEYGNVVNKALSYPITEEKIIYQLSKTGDTVYKVNNIKVILDNNIFINIKELNELRRSVLKKLDDLRIKNKSVSLNKFIKNINVLKDNTVRINALVRNENQLLTCLNNNINDIYITDLNLYNKYKDIYKNLYYRERRVNNSYRNIDLNNVLACELGSVNKYKDKNIISDYYLNIVNSKSIEFLENLNVNRITLSVENNLKYIDTIDFSNHNVEVIVYGRVELMIIKSPVVDNNSYIYDKDNNSYPIYKDDNVIVILSKNKINYLDRIKYFKSKKIYNYRIELFDDKDQEIEKIIKQIRSEL